MNSAVIPVEATLCGINKHKDCRCDHCLRTAPARWRAVRRLPYFRGEMSGRASLRDDASIDPYRLIFKVGGKEPSGRLASSANSAPAPSVSLRHSPAGSLSPQVTEGWFHTQSLTNNGIYGKARQRDEGIPPYRLLALPAAYYKKLCRERLIPVQEPNQRSGWPLKFDCGRSDLPYIFRITLPAKNLSPFYPIHPEKYVDKPRFIWYIIQAIFCGHGPLVKRLRQRPLTPLTWVRFPHGTSYQKRNVLEKFLI